MVLPDLSEYGLHLGSEGFAEALAEGADAEEAPWGSLDGVPLPAPPNEALGARRRAVARLTVAGLAGTAHLSGQLDDLVRRVLSGWDPLAEGEAGEGGE